MPRPTLSSSLSNAEFSSWYWLKSELAAFCRSAGLPTRGGKPELTERIEHLLAGAASAAPAKARPPRPPMPATFTWESIIQPGWRCSQPLRAFFENECGRGFHFNATLRDFIAHGAGRSLGEALAAYRLSSDQPPQGAIAAQFEYNRHTREFFQQNPAATKAEAIAAWWKKRGRERPPP